ncbi:hypothetical protein NCAST_19_00250 [Nocardia asteroides NBRC 15531]|uniref:Uncharacterized protein n=1 Tax=Nocardia asteroides NBRC 15531 TaxID=1110697 RepID=U5EA22_NOCAS|nr:hypothetical protein NCAST_19_00250 [Nocardia asteroides NBRC 15531]
MPLVMLWPFKVTVDVSSASLQHRNLWRGGRDLHPCEHIRGDEAGNPMSVKPTGLEGVGRNGFGSLRHTEGSRTELSGRGLAVCGGCSGSELFPVVTDKEGGCCRGR